MRLRHARLRAPPFLRVSLFPSHLMILYSHRLVRGPPHPSRLWAPCSTIAAVAASSALGL